MIMNIKPRSGEHLLLVWFSWLVGRVLSSTFDLTHDVNFNLGWLDLEFGSCHEKFEFWPTPLRDWNDLCDTNVYFK